MKRLYRIGWGGGGERWAKPNMTAVLLRRGEFGETHRGISCDNKDRDWSDASTNREMPKTVSNNQKLRKRKDGSSPILFTESMALPIP